MTTKRFIVIVLDSFGVGAMADDKKVRPQDVQACTCGHILEKLHVRLPNLEALGLMNALGHATPEMQLNPKAVFGRAALAHDGADTFMGHQEIMGTKPNRPVYAPFAKYLEKCRQALLKAGYTVEVKGEQAHYLFVNGAVTVADNIEADYGQIYNVSGALDKISFAQVLAIGKIIRTQVDVSRVIALGGAVITPQDLLDAVEVREQKYIGVNCGRSGVYNQGYQVVHLGYGVDPSVQLPTILGERGIPCTLLGKVADIVANAKGTSIGCVDTAQVLALTLQAMHTQTGGFIATNVQETDLAGHAEDTKRYGEVLQIADAWLGKIRAALQPGDILVVMADHGNDPTSGSSHHTREYVPLLLASPGLQPAALGLRRTMSDVGATAADYLGVPAPQAGTSFLSLLKWQ